MAVKINAGKKHVPEITKILKIYYSVLVPAGKNTFLRAIKS